MILGLPARQALLTLPLLAYGLALLFAMSLPGAVAGDAVWRWVLLLSSLAFAVWRTRLVRRRGAWIEVWGPTGRTRVEAAGLVVHLETSIAGRFAAMRWQLACEAQPQRTLTMGLLLGAKRGVVTAGQVLDLPLSFAAERALGGERDVDPVRTAKARRQRRALALLVLLALTLLVVTFVTAKGQLSVQCPQDRIVRVDDDLLMGSRTLDLRPGHYELSVWSPADACWRKRRVGITMGKATTIHCEELAAETCVSGQAPAGWHRQP